MISLKKVSQPASVQIIKQFQALFRPASQVNFNKVPKETIVSSGLKAGDVIFYQSENFEKQAVVFTSSGDRLFTITRGFLPRYFTLNKFPMSLTQVSEKIQQILRPTGIDPIISHNISILSQEENLIKPAEQPEVNLFGSMRQDGWIKNLITHPYLLKPHVQFLLGLKVDLWRIIFYEPVLFIHGAEGLAPLESIAVFSASIEEMNLKVASLTKEEEILVNALFLSNEGKFQDALAVLRGETKPHLTLQIFEAFLKMRDEFLSKDPQKIEQTALFQARHNLIVNMVALIYKNQREWLKREIGSVFWELLNSPRIDLAYRHFLKNQRTKTQKIILGDSSVGKQT